MTCKDNPNQAQSSPAPETPRLGRRALLSQPRGNMEHIPYTTLVFAAGLIVLKTSSKLASASSPTKEASRKTA